jgi:hypothetical protein
MMHVLSLALLAALTSAWAQTPELQQIRRKVQTGQPLTMDERQTLQRANAQQMETRRAQYMKDHAPQSSMGFVALTDLGTGKYKGEEGGLYPGGENAAPPGHQQAGLRAARDIVARDGGGKPAANGKIVLLSIGFSNPNMEFPAFQKLVAEDAAVNPSLITVNGCVGGQASDVIANPQSNYWNLVAQHLESAGVTAQQVQALWIKLVFPGPSLEFPAESKKLHKDIIGTLHVVRDRFPNARLAYLSSRTYGGYTEVGGSPEPWAYETGFSVKWAVADQIAGKAELNFDPAKGEVRSPWIAWGPYLWPDGLHPSTKGQAKIAALMLRFFKGESTARTWFLH